MLLAYIDESHDRSAYWLIRSTTRTFIRPFDRIRRQRRDAEHPPTDAFPNLISAPSRSDANAPRDQCNRAAFMRYRRARRSPNRDEADGSCDAPGKGMRRH
jgi:hypothetical protein